MDQKISKRFPTVFRHPLMRAIRDSRAQPRRYLEAARYGLTLLARTSRSLDSSKISSKTKEEGRVLLTEILLPRIARQGAVCLISTRGQARKARIEKFELDLDEGFQPYHPPSRKTGCSRCGLVFVAATACFAAFDGAAAAASSARSRATFGCGQMGSTRMARCKKVMGFDRD